MRRMIKMSTRSNDRPCVLAQKKDLTARNLLLENNLDFVKKTAFEQCKIMGLEETDFNMDVDNLVQERCIGLLNTIPLFKAERGMKFLTYAASTIRNAMIGYVRTALSRFEQRMTDTKNDLVLQRVS